MTQSTVVPAADFNLDGLQLAHGSHRDRGEECCFNEAVAWAAGEPHSDAPECISPVLRSFTMRLNDRLDETRRQQLKPYVFKVIGTKGDGKDPARMKLARDWLVTDGLAPWLELAQLPDLAEQVRGIDLTGTSGEIRAVFRSIRDQVWQARNDRYERVREQVKAALIEKWSVGAVGAVGAAEAVAAVAAAGAAEAAAAAGAAEAVAAVAAAGAAEAVAAVAAAEAAEAAEAVAAKPFEIGSKAYWEFRDKVYALSVERYKADPIMDKIRDLRDRQFESGLALLDRMIDPAP